MTKTFHMRGPLFISFLINYLGDLSLFLGSEGDPYYPRCVIYSTKMQTWQVGMTKRFQGGFYSVRIPYFCKEANLKMVVKEH